MRKSRSSGSVGERGGNEPLYPDSMFSDARYVGMKKTQM